MMIWTLLSFVLFLGAFTFSSNPSSLTDFMLCTCTSLPSFPVRIGPSVVEANTDCPGKKERKKEREKERKKERERKKDYACQVRPRALRKGHLS
eukprot:992972-Pelagomonas_calceolata.AAC.1